MQIPRVLEPAPERKTFVCTFNQRFVDRRGAVRVAFYFFSRIDRFRGLFVIEAANGHDVPVIVSLRVLFEMLELFVGRYRKESDRIIAGLDGLIEVAIKPKPLQTPLESRIYRRDKRIDRKATQA
ncbi:MAG: hypothetical protein R3B54_10205 [Bdellovibrionota bacterium]